MEKQRECDPTAWGGIAVRREAGRLTIVLDRPAKANALRADMLSALRDTVRDAEANVLVLTGAGSVFSGGADLSIARDGLLTSPLWEEASAALAAFPGLSIAALNGTCAGGAMGLALACDLRIAVPKAVLFYPVMRLGFLPQPSDPARLSRLVGTARAKLILMAGARVSADEALSIGLVDRVVEDLDDALNDLSRDALAAPDGHVAAVKWQIS